MYIGIGDDRLSFGFTTHKSTSSTSYHHYHSTNGPGKPYIRSLITILTCSYSLVYPTASRHDPTDILASRDSALEVSFDHSCSSYHITDPRIQPSPSPRSSTVSGYVAERGSAVGTASPRLVYSRALISPRRVPSPRDLGPDAHAYSEISVAAGSSTSAVVVGEQLCRTLSASGNAGHPDTSRDFPDEQTISRPTPTSAPLCVAFLAGIRRPR